MRLLFIHIGKTGGRTVRHLLKSQKDDLDYDCIHNNVLIRKQNCEIIRFEEGYNLDLRSYELIAYFVRNPYERLKSCYQYFAMGGLNQFEENRFPADEIKKKWISRNVPNFQRCCDNLKEFCEQIPHAQPMSDSIPKIPAEIPLFQGSYENYKNDLLRLFARLNLPLSREDVPRTNASENKHSLIYTDDMKHSVYNFYKEDFQIFGYEK